MVSGASNPKEALVNDMRAEYDRVQLRIKELQTLVEQSKAEVKRLQQRSVDLNARLSHIEANFETVPRNDIKVVYTNLLETRTRLLTMQAQLEKVQQDQSQLEGFGNTLTKFMAALEGVRVDDVHGVQQGREPTGPTLAEATQTIIRMVEAQEAERKRLAGQMHDGPAQSLTNFILQAEICQRLFDRNPDKAAEELLNLKASAQNTFQRVRNFIFDLRPMMLDDLGMVPTTRRYIDNYVEKSGIEVKVNVVGDERRRMESHTEVTMFRGLQELLGYIRDISQGHKVEIMLDVAENPIRASVTFDGNNLLQTEETVAMSEGKMAGLVPMKERVSLIGGSVEIAVDGDTNRVEIVLPAEEPV